MVSGVEKDSFRIGKMKFGLASCADLALGTGKADVREDTEQTERLATFIPKPFAGPPLYRKTFLLNINTRPIMVRT